MLHEKEQINVTGPIAILLLIPLSFSSQRFRFLWNLSENSIF